MLLATSQRLGCRRVELARDGKKKEGKKQQESAHYLKCLCNVETQVKMIWAGSLNSDF